MLYKLNLEYTKLLILDLSQSGKKLFFERERKEKTLLILRTSNKRLINGIFFISPASSSENRRSLEPFVAA
jgi:hypothetical protein